VESEREDDAVLRLDDVVVLGPFLVGGDVDRNERHSRIPAPTTAAAATAPAINTLRSRLKNEEEVEEGWLEACEDAGVDDGEEVTGFCCVLRLTCCDIVT